MIYSSFASFFPLFNMYQFCIFTYFFSQDYSKGQVVIKKLTSLFAIKYQIIDFFNLSIFSAISLTSIQNISWVAYFLCVCVVCIEAY